MKARTLTATPSMTGGYIDVESDHGESWKVIPTGAILRDATTSAKVTDALWQQIKSAALAVGDERYHLLARRT